MNLHEEIRGILADLPAESSEKNGVTTAKYVVAERKSLLSKKQLTYIAKYRIDAVKQEIRFTEMLKESGYGLSSGGGDFGSSPGFGFKKETYKTGWKGREGTIQEQSNLFGEKYTYTFDFTTIREAIEKKAQESGYAFKYHITSRGI